MDESLILARAQEAEQRAFDDVAAILKELGFDATYLRSPAVSPWAQLKLLLSNVTHHGLDPTSAKTILHTGLIRRLIRYVANFKDTFSVSGGDGERANVPSQY